MAITLVTSRNVNNVDTTWSLTNVTQSAVLNNNEQVWNVTSSIQPSYFFSCNNTVLQIPYTDGVIDLGEGLEISVSNHQLSIYVGNTLVGSLSNFNVVGSSSFCYLFFVEDVTNKNAIPVLMTFYWTQNDDRNHCTFKWLTTIGTEALYNWVHKIAYSGGAGSGYIGNSLVSNKKMVGYNVPTSSAEGTKTESVNDVSASAVSGKPKSGNGFARIRFLRDS